MIQAVYILLK